MSISQKTTDGLTNAITGMGGLLDKSSHSTYQAGAVMGQSELEAMYRSDWIAAKAIDLVAEDMTRAWRTMTGLGQEQIEALERAEKRLGVRSKVQEAIKWARLYGGALIVMRIDGTGEIHEPLNADAVQPGALRYLVPVDRWRASSSGVTTTDILSRNYGKPEYYQVGGSRVHHTRVLRFDGVSLPYLMASQNSHWGDSILERMRVSVINAAAIYQSVSSLVHEASLDVLKIPGLMNLVSDCEGEKNLLKRLQAANLSKSIHNMLVLDANEEYEKKTGNFSGLQPLLYDYIAAAAGAADIPITRLLGVSPGGLNSTGESDLENYYTSISTRQEAMLAPALDQFDQVLLRSVLGSVPDEYSYIFNSLKMLTDERRAAMEKLLVEKHVAASALLPDETIYQKMRDEGLYDISDEFIEEAEMTEPDDEQPLI